MKNPIAIIIAVLLIFALALTAFTQEPTKPQQPPTQPPKQDPQKQKPTEQKEPEEQDEVLKLETRQVTVPVMITDGFGRYLTGFKKADFTLREDGVVQEIDDFSDETTPFNVALLIDLSLSTKNKLDDIKRTAIDFVKLLQPRDKVLIVAFNERVQPLGDFTGNQKDLEKSIKSLKASYLTSLYDALDVTIKEKLLTVPGRKAIVVLSDGVDTGSKRATYDSALELITRTGIVTYTVRYETRNDGSKQIRPDDLPNLKSPFINRFITHWQQPSGTYQKQRPKDRDLLGVQFLQELADRSGARYLRSESAIGTSLALRLVADEIRNQYTLAYTPKNMAEDGKFREISVSLKRNDVLVRARQGYIAPKPKETKEPEKPKE